MSYSFHLLLKYLICRLAGIFPSSAAPGRSSLKRTLLGEWRIVLLEPQEEKQQTFLQDVDNILRFSQVCQYRRLHSLYSRLLPDLLSHFGKWVRLIKFEAEYEHLYASKVEKPQNNTSSPSFHNVYVTNQATIEDK